MTLEEEDDDDDDEEEEDSASSDWSAAKDNSWSAISSSVTRISLCPFNSKKELYGAPNDSYWLKLKI